MAINLPGELAWTLNMLGFNWIPVDEDELRIAAGYVRDFESDLEGLITKVDTSVAVDVSRAFEAGASDSMVRAWDDNRDENMNKLLELLGPGAEGMEILADAIEALKLKVIAELIITAAQIAAAIASAAVTFGLGAAASVAIYAARRKAMTFIMNVMIEKIIMQVMETFEDQIATGMSMLADRILSAPVTQGMVGDPGSYKADLDALESIAADMDATAGDFESISEDFSAKIGSLEVFTGMDSWLD